MNKNIVKYVNTIKVFIDSYSFEKLLSEGNKDAEKILNCYTNNYFDFTRSTLDSKNKELNIIPEFQKKYDLF